MPRLENFTFVIPLEAFSRGEFTTDDLALGHLPSLQDVNVGLYFGVGKVSEEVVTKVTDKLRREADVHPNQPGLHLVAR
jgi:disease resistance protein RPM1